MKTIKVFVDEEIVTKDFLQSSIVKYLSPSIDKKIGFMDFVETIRFIKTETCNEKYSVAYSNKILTFTGSDRGLIYALFDFLHKLGWRFFTPKFEKFLLGKNRFNFHYPFAYSFDPKFEYRLNLWDGLSDEWLVKNGVNALFSRGISDLLGGSKKYAGLPAHTFNKFIPPDKYFKSNPEFFALNQEGERTTKQLCLSNEQMFEQALSEARGWLRNNPTAQYISVSQNDCRGECLCENCKAIKKDGNASDLIISFVNKFARAIREEFPKVKVQTLAYHYTIDPPKYEIPEENVVVMVAPIWSCENHAVTDETCGANKKFVAQLDGWRKLTDNVYIWKYFNDFSYYLTPFQCLNSQSENFNYYAKKGVKGFFVEGAHAGETTDFCELKAYLLAKLIYNPEMTKKEYGELIKEFCVCYYGEVAGKQMLKYLRLLIAVTRDSHYDCYPAPYTVISTSPNKKQNDKYFIRKAKLLFDTALKNTESKVKRKRIEKEYIAVLYFSLYTNFENDMLNASIAKRKKILEEQAFLFSLIDKYKIKVVRPITSGILVKKHNRRIL